MTLIRTIAVSFVLGYLLGTFGQTPTLYAQSDGLMDKRDDDSSLKELSLEELLQIHVTSANRREESIVDVPAAMTVITQEDIRRSGVRSVAEALRLANGLDVARTGGGSWAITTRGFASGSANKLLVLMDGRSLYSPLFAGTFWDVQGPLLDDIARIEIIHGPGGSLWGVNAVNGIINIITKSARDSQGGLLTTGGGLNDRFGSIRYGGQIGSRTYYSGYAKYDYFGALNFRNSSSAEDPLQTGFIGLRVDSILSNSDSMTLQGNLYRTKADRRRQEDINARGGYLLGKWVHRFESGSDLQVQSYYDRTSRDIPPIFFEVRNTYDLDLQHHFTAGTKNDLVWGVEYFATADDTRRVPILRFEPEDRTLQRFGFFIQDELSVVPDRVTLTLGSKFQSATYSAFEFQPTMRIAWKHWHNNSIWGAISRAARLPTRLDEDLRIDFPGSIVNGNPKQKSEELIAYEGGYRYLASERASFGISTYFNHYDQLRSIEPSGVAGVLKFGNSLQGHTYGGELESLLQVRAWWQLRFSYAHVQTRLRSKLSRQASSVAADANDPKHHIGFRSSMNLPRRVELDFWLRYVSGRPLAISPTTTPLAGHHSFDVRLGWRPVNQLNLSVVGQNLPEEQHAQFPASVQEEVKRSVYGKVTWAF